MKPRSPAVSGFGFSHQAPAKPPGASPRRLALALSIQKEFIMAQGANLEEVFQPLHDAYVCLLADGLDGAGEALRILVNEAGQVVDCAVLVAVGVTVSGHRRMLGVSVDCPKPRSTGERC